MATAPIQAQRIYADHNATSPLLAEVQPRLVELLSLPGGNPSAAHAAGRRTKELIVQAQQRVAKLAGRTPEEVVFVGSATEANATALHGHFITRREQGAERILVSAIEHPSVIENARHLQRFGARVQLIDAEPNGMVSLAHLQALLGDADDVACVAVMHANNETGVVQPIDAVASLAAARGVPLHVDTVQSLGKLTQTATCSQTQTVSAHKLGGLPGAAALIGQSLPALFPGGGQQNGRRGGSEAWQAISVFGDVCELWTQHGSTYRANMASARAAFEASLLASLLGVTVVGADQVRLPNTSLILVDGVRGQALLTSMDLLGVAVSHGAACATGSMSPSPVLLAMGFTEELARTAVRISFGPHHQARDGERVAEALSQAATRLRAI